ncbi:phosphatidylethanolamine-binding protein [Dunaliella salina]|uniref:Phosphatidylethanolamine-binding protein n=1 Tax=Dunaliella salina TaxID=3046 RepID=A0ABQ7H4D6_DUNSA|nr:phosphatidylethanolamine-binding protein [Dunaliella salina]|eukprot:KAF5841712.1 phosphatidylethanolamine-binding protein [Dunaliella salina]
MEASHAQQPAGVPQHVVSGINDVVPFLEQGTWELVIKYGGEVISQGEHIPVDTPALSKPPQLDIRPHDLAQGRSFSVIMIDPDAPDPENPSAKEWLHWYRVNISGLELLRIASGHAVKGPGNGEDVVEYSPPHPVSGTHRYIFLLYAQEHEHQRPSLLRMHLTDHAVEGPVTIGLHRMCFDHRAWATRHDLHGPLACSYFYTRAHT